MDEDLELHADMVFWQYDEDGDLTPRSDPLPLATMQQVLEGVPYLDGVGLYKIIPVLKSDQFQTTNILFRSSMTTGIKS